MAATVSTGKGRGKAANTAGKHFADNGMQADGKKRYPLDNADEVRSAWDYIHHGNDADKYNSYQVQHIKSEIKIAAAKFGITLSGDHDGDDDNADLKAKRK